MTTKTTAPPWRVAAAGLTATALLALVACGSSTGTDATTGTPAAPTALAVTLTDTGCQPATFEVAPGAVTITITNSSSSRSEFEIRTAKPSIVGESEGIATGATAELDVSLDDGTYDLVCGTGEVFEGALVVGNGVGGGDGTATTAGGTADLTAAVAAYTTWVDGQLDTLVTDTRDLSDAVGRGDLRSATSAYAESRLPYERLEPIAELFPDLDGAMDAREDDFSAGVDDPAFTGWHRIEHLLHEKGDLAAAAPFAVELAQNAVKLKTRVDDAAIDPGTMVNGAAGPIEEAATEITGEEDRYSQLSLADLAANVEGTDHIVDLLSTELQEADPTLLAAIEQDLSAFDSVRSAYQAADGYRPYDQLTEADRDTLKAVLASLSEDLAQLPRALRIEVS